MARQSFAPVRPVRRKEWLLVKKKVVCIMMCAVLSLGLVACAGGGSGYDSGGAQSTAAPDAGWAQQEGLYTSGGGWEGDDGWYDEDGWDDGYSGEEYDDSDESPFRDVLAHPLSTFSSDVDTASYSNMRRYINEGAVPQGVRIEELVNYFDYGYPAPQPSAEHPFSVTAEVAPCPWNENHQLAMIGVQGAELRNSEKIANNIVFLIDVSGSMSSENKLPLLQESFKLMLEKLGKNDVVSIVTYASGDAVVADSVPGSEQRALSRLIDSLEAGGGTAGAKGLETAYQLAEANYIGGGNNRIILATDGDFNIGPSSNEELESMIEEKREKGIFISVLGFGMYNLKDNKMETIADKGNGNYAYIDTLAEARKVLVDEFDATMFTIAKDLKFQVEFNPERVAQYRLVGYNNRRMRNEDFDDDRKDAGDVGAGHSVTVFYELIPAGGAAGELKYQDAPAAPNSEFMHVKIRYKPPLGDESRLMEQAVPAEALGASPSETFAFASSVAEFGLVLTNSQYKGDASAKAAWERAKNNLGEDPYGLREEYVQLVRAYGRLA